MLSAQICVSLLDLVHGMTRDNCVFCGAATLVGDLAAKDAMRATRQAGRQAAGDTFFVLGSGPAPTSPAWPAAGTSVSWSPATVIFWGWHHLTLE